MSWDAHLYTVVDGNVVAIEPDWNYTHNTNPMIAAVLRDAGKTVGTSWMDEICKREGEYWCASLNGLSGAQGAELLEMIVQGLEAEPERFKAMNPENGWGDYNGILKKVREMLEASRQYPSATWHIG